MRDAIEIRVWLLRNGHTVQGIARTLGYKTNSPVSSTITGTKNLRRVLLHLQAIGCPDTYLDLPKNMVRKA